MAFGVFGEPTSKTGIRQTLTTLSYIIATMAALVSMAALMVFGALMLFHNSAASLALDIWLGSSALCTFGFTSFMVLASFDAAKEAEMIDNFRQSTEPHGLGFDFMHDAERNPVKKPDRR